MAAKTYNNIVDSAFFAAAETTFATQVDHAGSDVLPHKPTASMTYTEAEEELEECTGTHGVAEFIRLPQKPVAWSIGDSYLKPSAAAGNEPDWGVVLKSAFGSQQDADNTGDTTTATTHTTTTMTVTTPASWTVGAIVKAAGNVTAGIADQVVFITAKSGSVVTFAPALSEAPGAAGGDTFRMGWSWKLDKDGAVSFTGVHKLSNTVKHAAGCFAQSLSVKHSRNAATMASASGVGSGRFSVGGQSTLDGAILIGALTLDVQAGHGEFFHIGSSGYTIATIEAEGANTEEAIKITAVSGDTLTITRDADGNGASAHGDTAVLKPWSPTLTKYGSPLAANTASFLIGGYSSPIHEFSWTLDNGRTLREDEYGAGGISDGIIPGENNSQKITATITGKFKAASMAYWGYAQAQTTQAVFNKTGAPGTSGAANYSVICTYIPSFRFTIPELPEGAPEAILTLEGTALETSGDDEIYFGIV